MNSRKILLIERNHELNNHLKGILERNGHAIKAIFNINDVKSSIEQYTPDLLILGIDTYGTIGIAGLRLIKGRFQHLPIIIVTIDDSFNSSAMEKNEVLNLNHYIETVLSESN